VLFFAARAGYFRFDEKLKASVGKVLLAGAVLGMFLFVAQNPLGDLLKAAPVFREQALLAALAIAGCLIYGGLIFGLLGRSWLRGLADRSAAMKG
jgi:hypothetical protein